MKTPLLALLPPLLLALAAAISACGPSQDQRATETALVASETASAWTSTPTPTSSATPSPSPTSTPTPTPVGGGSGLVLYVNEHVLDAQSQTVLSNILSMSISPQAIVSLTNNDNSAVQYFAPSCSPYGDSLVYQRIEGFKSELFSMMTDGTSVQKISPAPMFSGQQNIQDRLADVYPSWSPDARSLAFSSNRHSLASWNDDFEIYTISIDTFELVQLTNSYRDSSHPSWSPDGSRIAFMSDRDGDWEIYVMNADGKSPIKLTDNRATDRFPTWSPDGTKIAFHSDRDGNLEVYLIEADGSNPTRLTQNPATDVTARWSPDGQWLVFQSDRDGDDELYMLEVATTNVVKLTDNADKDYLSTWCR